MFRIYQPSRSGDCAKAFLEGFAGYLHTDGHAGYHAKLPATVTIVGCWAHVRRRFDKALKVIPEKKRKGSAPAQAILQLGQIYKLKEEFANLLPDENYKARYEARLEKTKPLLEAFFAWCKAQTALPKSVLGQAITYALGERFYLEHFLLDGRLEIDNNRAERSIKPFVIGRKNWLFSNTSRGAHASAVLYSIIETAKENHVDPFAYLSHIFHTAPQLDIQNHPEKVEQLLPWNFSPSSVARAAP